MSDPNEVLGQLLSPAQAATLDAAGRQVWTTAAAALESLHGAAPSLTGLDGRLVMPDEITGEFGRPHLTVPFELSTNQDQAATAYLVIETDPAPPISSRRPITPTTRNNRRLSSPRPSRQVLSRQQRGVRPLRCRLCRGHRRHDSHSMP